MCWIVSASKRCVVSDLSSVYGASGKVKRYYKTKHLTVGFLTLN